MFIKTTDDEALLALLKEDIRFYVRNKGADATDGLRRERLVELQALAEVPDEKDIIRPEKYKAATGKRCAN